MVYSADGEELGYFVRRDMTSGYMLIYNEEIGMMFRIALLGKKGHMSYPDNRRFYRDANCDGLYLYQGFENMIFGFYYKVHEDKASSYPNGVELMVIDPSTKYTPDQMEYIMGVEDSFTVWENDVLVHQWNWECTDYPDPPNNNEPILYTPRYPQGSRDWWKDTYPDVSFYRLVPFDVADLPFTYPVSLPVRVSSE